MTPRPATSDPAISDPSDQQPVTSPVTSESVAVLPPTVSSPQARPSRGSSAAFDVLVAGLAGALTALALRSSSWLVAAVPLLVVIGGLAVRARVTGISIFRAGAIVRTLFAVVVAVVLVRNQPGIWTVVFAGATTVLLLGLLALEPLLVRGARFRVPVVANLPGVEPAPVLSSDTLMPRLASLGALAAGLLVAALAGPAWLWLVLTVVLSAPTIRLGVFGQAKLRAMARIRRDTPQAIVDYAPEFVVYTSRPDDASYQVAMWLPYLKRVGKPFLVVTRNHAPAVALAELADIPVIEARQIADLERVLTDSLKAAFYVNASAGNGVLVRYSHLVHVYLGHGDSDKPPSYNPTHVMYDRIFAAGPAAVRRYADHGVLIPEEKFRVVGRPQVEGVQRARKPIGAISEPVVLYAPTWRGHVEETLLYSLPRGEEIVAALLARGATVIFRPHPFSYKFEPDAAMITQICARLAADRESTGRAHLWGPAAEAERGILDCINESDAMVSDVSSVVSDYLFSGKPFVMVAVPSAPAEFVRAYPVARAAYVVDRDLNNLDSQLDHLLGTDPLAEERMRIQQDYLGNFSSESYADGFVSAVDAVLLGSTGRIGEFTEGTEEPLGDDPEETSETSAGLATSAAADNDGLLEVGEDGEVIEIADAEEADAEEADEPGETSELGGDGGVEGAGEVEGTAPSLRGRWRASEIRRWFRRYYRMAGRRVPKLVGLGVALIAFALVLLSISSLVITPPLLPAAVMVAALVVELRWALRRWRQPARWRRFISEFKITRTVLTVLVATLVADQEAWSPGWVVIVAVLAAALAAESHIRGAWGRIGLQVYDLPELNAGILERLPRGALPVIYSGVLALLAASAALGLPLGVPIAAALLLVVLYADGLGRALVRARRVMAAEELLRPALLARQPKFALYFASTVGAGYQIGMWLPYLLRIGEPFVILSRDLAMAEQVARVTRAAEAPVPIIYRPTLRSVEEAVVPSMTAAFYVNNAVKNSHLVERRELIHVWLNHGDSEKPACYNPVHAIYDVLFVAGQAGIDRYARHGVQIPREKFRIVGRPQVSAIQQHRDLSVGWSGLSVLYAPTWQGPYADSRVYSLPMGEQIVTALLAREARVVFRAHPFNYRYKPDAHTIARIGRLLEADRAATGRPHLWGPAAERELTIEECFNESDAMICDVSAVVSDYLQSAKPFSIVAVGRTTEQLLDDVPAARAAYVLTENLENLDAVLDDLLQRDPLRAERATTRDYYLGDIPPHRYVEEGFLAAARSIIDLGSPAPQVVTTSEAEPADGLDDPVSPDRPAPALPQAETAVETLQQVEDAGYRMAVDRVDRDRPAEAARPEGAGTGPQQRRLDGRDL